MKRKLTPLAKLFIAIIAIAPMLTLLSCGEEMNLDRKLEIFYQDGTSEVITLSYHSNVTHENKTPVLHNGCLYRRKRTGATMWSEDDYIGATRCGVKWFKTLSVTKRPRNK